MFFYERFNVKKGDFQRAMVYFSQFIQVISYPSKFLLDWQEVLQTTDMDFVFDTLFRK